MSLGEVVNAIVNGFVALGTIFLAIAAIYGDRIRAILLGPKLKLTLREPRGTSFPSFGRRLYFLEVVNSRPKALATACHVRVKKVWRQIPNGEFVDIPLAFPLQLSWAPSDLKEFGRTVRNEERTDFGYVEPGRYFWLAAPISPPGLDQLIKESSTVRFGLEIVSNEFVSTHLQVFEVSWIGDLCDDLDKIADHVRIREIAS